MGRDHIFIKGLELRAHKALEGLRSPQLPGSRSGGLIWRTTARPDEDALCVRLLKGDTTEALRSTPSADWQINKGRAVAGKI